MIDATSKRGAVMAAALELISEHGFHGASTAMIAERAGVGVGTIYRYFATKDELISALYLELKTRFSQALLARDDEGLELKMRFERIWTALVREYAAHPTELRFIEQYAHSPFLSRETRGQQTELSAPFNRLFERGRATGVLRELPPDVLRALMYGAALQLAKAHIGGLELNDTLLAASFEACWDAVRVIGE